MSKIFEYEGLGTKWKIIIWDEISQEIFDDLKKEILDISKMFQETYSRFDENSFISEISNQTGIIKVEKEFLDILKIYQEIYKISRGKVTPLIGNTISDLGYDKDYSLTPKETIRTTPDFEKVVKILNEKSIEIYEKVLFDFGAIGKGFLIDKISNFLIGENINKFLVDGSGDMFYENKLDNEKIRVGLEHPFDHSKIVGTLELKSGALCSSATTRRAWREYNHYIDPDTNSSPKEIVATWVLAKNASYADTFASTLFFNNGQNILEKSRIKFEYCVLNKELEINYSKDFNAEFY